MMYEHQATTSGLSLTDFAAFLNAEGAKGYRYVSDQSFTDGSKALLIRDANTTYSYEVLSAPITSADFVGQANAEGARSFQFAGLFGQGYVYRKNNGAPTTWSYVAQPSQLSATKTSASFLTQANAQGANGYRYVLELSFGATDSIHFYEKGAAGVYTFEVLANPATEVALLEQLNGQGLRGFRFQTPYSFGGDSPADRNIYVKDTSQTMSFAVSWRDVVGNNADALAQYNEEGAKGNGFLGQFSMPGGGSKNWYYTPGGCIGILCDVRNPFGF